MDDYKNYRSSIEKDLNAAQKALALLFFMLFLFVTLSAWGVYSLFN